MLSMINRGRIKDLAVVQEFEHLIARLRGFLAQSFDADGQLIVADPNLAVFSVGDYKPSARTADHPGWLLCDGRQVSRSTYADLYNIVGTTYGSGDGSTTFNIPDLQGRFLLGKATSGTGDALGETGGAIDHTHAMGSHAHTISEDGGHDHGGSTGVEGDHDHGGHTGVEDATQLVADGIDHDVVQTHQHVINNDGDHAHSISSDGDHSHGGVTGSASGTTGAANPPFIVGNYFIFTGV